MGPPTRINMGANSSYTIAAFHVAPPGRGGGGWEVGLGGGDRFFDVASPAVTRSAKSRRCVGIRDT